MKANNNNSLDLIIEKVLDIALYWKAEAEKAKEELKNQQVYETKKKIAELDKEMNYFVHDYPLTEYACDECGAGFIDRDDNYAYCPYCGRKIVDGKE